MRALAIVLLLVAACKKKEPEPQPDPPTTGARGHSITKVKEEPEGHASGSAQPAGEEKPVEKEATAEIDAGAAPDPKGKAAYRDDENHVHGPGGPVFQGRGEDCTPERDHCLRDGVWIATGPYRPGALFRGTPVFEFESKWWNWHGDEVDPSEFTWLFKTKPATISDVTVGEPIVWLIHSSSSDHKFVNNEADALTTSRWEVGVVDSVGSDYVRVKGWDSNVPIDTVRAITEKKKSS